jgi:hypothetical protein
MKTIEQLCDMVRETAHTIHAFHAFLCGQNRELAANGADGSTCSAGADSRRVRPSPRTGALDTQPPTL